MVKGVHLQLGGLLTSTEQVILSTWLFKSYFAVDVL